MVGDIKKQLRDIKNKKARYIKIDGMDFPGIVSGFTTRFGGVSRNEYESLNLNFFREDNPELVKKNYELLSEDIEVQPGDMVLSRQVHGDKVIQVTHEHKGMGILKERIYDEADGLSTNIENIMLVTYYADCVPLFFYDPVKRVICLSHSGWKGTLLDIAGKSVSAMVNHYGSNPGNIHVSFGPHIGSCCFEVGDDVAGKFFSAFSWSRESANRNDAGKWMLNLEAIITQNLKRHGLNENNIKTCPICTKCECESFFSHRGSGGKTGTGAAFLMMRG